MHWPRSEAELADEQRRLAATEARPWRPPTGRWSAGGVFICSSRPKLGSGAAGDPQWAAAAVTDPAGSPRSVRTAVVCGEAGAPYAAGLLALRDGAHLEAAVRALPRPPDVLLVNSTGRDHPRRAGLALHLGALLEIPTVGVTHRPLLAAGNWPQLKRGARAPLLLDGEHVGFWLVTRHATRPLAIHAAWRTDPETAAEIALAATTRRARTPEPLRRARRAARTARTGAERRTQAPGDPSRPTARPDGR